MDRKTTLKFSLVSIVSFTLGLLTNFLLTKVEEYRKSEDDGIGFVAQRGDIFDLVQVTDFKMENGFIYTGGINGRKRFGQGKLITPKGTIYEGEWIGNEIIEGKMITDRSEYSGSFKNLSPNGYGTMHYKDGSYYQGSWADGVKSGIGLFVDSLGYESFGLWKGGIIDKSTANKNVKRKVYGIDLSHHNKIYDWGNLALYVQPNGQVYNIKPKEDYVFQPVNFVFLKATEGATHRDRNYLNNMMNAKKHHKIRGSYHFMHLTSSTVEEQVDNFLDYSIYEKGDLPPVLDIEVGKQAKAIGVAATREKVLKWLSMVEKRTGVRPIIYTSSSMKRDYFSSVEFSEYDFWIAHYKDTEPEYKNYLIWQFTDKGLLYGHSLDNPIDVNLYKGSHNDFMSLCRADE